MMVRLRVKELLQQKSMSMGKLSRVSDVSLNTIRRMCKDPGYSPTLHTMVSVAKALGVSISDLYEEISDEHNETLKN
jgi:DNA-binding Xre family transcriptional regulator